MKEIEDALTRILGGEAASELESVRLEFKDLPEQRDDSPRKLARAAICMANAEGGWVVVGVSDRLGGKEALRGTRLEPAAVQRRILELSIPALTVEVQAIERSGVRLLVIRVPRSHEIHADTEGRAFRRIGTSCQAMSPADHARVREEKRLVDWSAMPDESRAVQTLWPWPRLARA